jgi:flagellar protein FliS
MNPYSAAAQYRQSSAQGAHPVGWVVRLYDAILKDFGEALEALRAGQVERRAAALNHALLVIAELEGVLDHEQGGEVARHLQGLYRVSRAMILEANVRASSTRIDKLIGMFLPVRQAWQQVEWGEPSGGPNAAVQSPPTASETDVCERNRNRSGWSG